MSNIFDEFMKAVEQVQISRDRKSRNEIIRVATGEDVQELFSNPDELTVMSEIPPGLIMPLARMRQLKKILEEDAPMEEMLEKYILDEASK